MDHGLYHRLQLVDLLRNIRSNLYVIKNVIRERIKRNSRHKRFTCLQESVDCLPDTYLIQGDNVVQKHANISAD